MMTGHVPAVSCIVTGKNHLIFPKRDFLDIRSCTSCCMTTAGHPVGLKILMIGGGFCLAVMPVVLEVGPSQGWMGSQCAEL